MICRSASLCAVLGMYALAQTPSSHKKLVLHDFHAGPEPNPTFVRNNVAYLDTLPIDGIVVYMRDPSWTTNVTADVLAPKPMSYNAISSVLAPMTGIQTKVLKDNFGLMFAGPGIDLFNDALWSVRLQNLSHLGLALKIAGFKGLAFDNESYQGWSRYGGPSCSSVRTMKQCQEQARVRGRQMMFALRSQYAEIVVLIFNGPWISDTTFYDRTGLDNIAHTNQLSGPLFVGMVEEKGSNATVIDGGEFYRSKSAADFAARYQDQKYGIVSDIGAITDNQSRAAGPNGFVPFHLRPVWGTMISAGAGVLDRASGLDAAVFQTTLTNALNQVDEYVWLYTESMTFLKPPGTVPKAASKQWVDAVRSARKSPSSSAEPSPVPLGTTYLSSWTPRYSSNGWGPIEKNSSNGEKAAGDGRPISIRGRPFTNGLGVHASSEVIYDIRGRCSTLTAQIGVDDEVLRADETLYRNNSVLFQVWGDNALLFVSGALTRRSPVLPVRVDLRSRSELKLIVLGGPAGEAYAHADWADLQITCQ